MIDRSFKRKFLKELERRYGNVFMTCLATGIDRSTYYRWEEDDKEFGRRARQIIRLGRANGSDMCENGVLKKAREGDFNAQKYYLSHNSQVYKPKFQKYVVMDHRKTLPPPGPVQKSFTEMIHENEKWEDEQLERVAKITGKTVEELISEKRKEKEAKDEIYNDFRYRLEGDDIENDSQKNSASQEESGKPPNPNSA